MFSWLTGRKRVATTESVLQLEAAECGAASLSMVLSYFGLRLPLVELRSACGVSRDGSKASSLLKAARSYGLIAKGLKAEPDHLRKITPPMIAFVNFNHFLVVEGFKNGMVLLNDPAVGHRTVSSDEFDAMFTGVVLTFKPDENFKKGNSRPSVMRSLFARSKGFRSAAFYVFMASLALVIPGILIPVFSRVFVDQVLVQQLNDWLLPLVIGMLLTAVVRYGLTILQTHHLTRAEIQLSIKGSSELFAHILHLPISFFGARFSGEIANRLHLNNRLAGLLTGDIARAVLSLITAVFFLAIMAIFSWRVAVVVGVLNLLNLAVLISMTRKVSEGYQKLSIESGKLAGVGVSGLQDIETFKASGYENSFFTRWSGMHANLVDTEQQIAGASVFTSSFPALAAMLSSAAVLTIGGLDVMNGDMTIGSLVALQSLAVSFAAPIATLTSFGMSIQDVKSHVERIDDVLNHPLDAENNEHQNTQNLSRLPSGSIKLVDVSFGYLPLEPPLIENFSIDIPSGSRIALVGGSGSGKSTLGRIIAGLNKPSAGEVLFDGIAHSEWPVAALAATRAHVDQDIVLFEGSIRENLTLWDSTVPDTAIIRAAQDAMVHDVISARTGGYNAPIHEDGNNFSGGQRQRLEIARALAGDPRILILDEATSALDPVTENQLMENLQQRGCTLVIIAHRLSTIRDCDEIIVLDRGMPIERGTHTELVALNGAYKQLIED